MADNVPSDLQAKIREWLAWDQNKETCEEINSMVSNGSYDDLKKALLNRMKFGTAGLRGRMAAGYANMNDLVIIQTSQGFAKYLSSSLPDATSKGVVIGHDSRHNSYRFARLTACAFLNCGIPVYLLGKICPTPFVAFSVRELGAAAGVMVTASHNPKEDNGYKVYWNNGAQIIPPHDSGIQSCIEKNLTPWNDAWNIEKAMEDSRVTDPLPKISSKYYSVLSAQMLNKNTNISTPINFTVTAMHGVGHNYVVEAFKVCNFKPLIPVVEQMEPDPEFPTVKFPNPEEGKAALDLSFKTANENNSTVILANDPDADRLAIAEKTTDGVWKVFTGNEEGALLGWWAWYRNRQLTPNLDPDQCYMIASTVSSKILRAIAKKEGFHFEETLTGFKWMGNKADELLLQGKTVLFAFEEAIGYMNGSEVLDKDGVSAAMRVAECASYLQTQGKTLIQQLEHIYETYGYHVSNNSYFICSDQNIINAMFDRIRNFNGPNAYPTSVCKGKYLIKSVRDLTTGHDSAQEDERAVLPVDPTSQMITFSFANGCVLTLRTSGTEPKIKYYSEMCAKPDQKDWSGLKMELDELVEGVISELMEPQRNKLIPKAD